MKVTRRNFLRTAAIVTLGSSAAGVLAACAGQAPSAPAATAPAQQAPAVATAIVPQAISGGGIPTVPAAATAAAPAAAATPAAAASPAAAQPTAAAQPAARRGGSFIGSQEVDPVQLDPATSSNFSALQAYEHIYESLTGYDAATSIIPALAERWEVPNPSTYIFYLRQGVKFHNGKEMTSADVKYSLDRAMDEKTGSPWRTMLGPIGTIEATDKYTVKVSMKAPFPGLLGGLAALRNSGIVPEGWAETANTKLEAVGTGPFKLKEYVPTDYIAYERFGDYWNKELPYLENATLKVMIDQNARIAAMRSGQIMMAFLDAQGAQQLEGQSGITTLRSPSAWLATHPVNISRPPFNDKRVRKALRMAVDTNEVIQKAVFGAGVPSGPIATGFGDWALPDADNPYIKPDVEGAKKLLAEAGHPNGFKTTILCSPQYPEFVATSLVCQDSWRKIGVDAEVQQVEWGTYVARAGKKGGFDYDIGATAFTFRPDPLGYIDTYFLTGADTNNGYSDPEMDEWIKKANSIADTAERKELYTRIQKKLLDDSPYFWWYVKLNIDALSSKVNGYKQSFTGRRIFLKETWLTQ